MKTMLSLLTVLSLSVVLFGCGTAPTTAQVSAVNSGLRVATVGYITRGATKAEQAKRAEQVLGLAGMIRTYVTANGDVVVNLDTAAAAINGKILDSNLAPGDKQLAQIIVSEAIMQASDYIVVGASIGAQNAKLLLDAATQIERAVGVVDPSV